MNSSVASFNAYAATNVTGITVDGSQQLADAGGVGCVVALLGISKSMKPSTRDPGCSDLLQLPYCYMRPSAKRAVKATTWWVSSDLNGRARRLA
jgi:hypothetical protein